jgi:pimeloyl-ACP methyl ester carboxylesterase
MLMRSSPHQPGAASAFAIEQRQRGIVRMKGAIAAIAIVSCAGLAALAQPAVRTLEVNGTSLAYVEQGEGTQVIFVHGSGADLRTWGYQMAPFGRWFRALAYSRRYHYPNPGSIDGPAYTAAVHARDLIGFVEALHAGPAHLVGSSYGGSIALLAARERPDLVRSLVLTEPALFALLPPGSPERLPLARLRAARERLEGGDTAGALQIFVDTIIGPGASLLMPASTRVMLTDNLPALRREAQAPEDDPPFSCEDAGRVHVPVLLLSGAASPSFFTAIARTLGNCLPEVERVVVPGAAHAVHAQQPERFNELAIAFLRRHAGPAAVN